MRFSNKTINIQSRRQTMDSFSCQNEQYIMKRHEPELGERRNLSTLINVSTRGLATIWVRHWHEDKSLCRNTLDSALTLSSFLMFKVALQRTLFLLLFYRRHYKEKWKHIPTHSVPSQDEIMEHASNSGILIKAVCIVVRRHNVTNCWHAKKVARTTYLQNCLTMLSCVAFLFCSSS